MKHRLEGRLDSRTRSEREAGVTLVEMLLAVALLGFVLLGITPLFVASVKSNFSANEYTSIHVLARDRLEQLMNLPFTDAQLAAGEHCVALPAKLPSGALNPFTVTYTVYQFQIPSGATVATNGSFVPTPASSAAQYQYKQIDVTAVGHQPRNRHLRTMVSGCLANPRPSRSHTQRRFLRARRRRRPDAMSRRRLPSLRRARVLARRDGRRGSCWPSPWSASCLSSTRARDQEQQDVADVRGPSATASTR
jgi:Tfp pilus assembly protein PilV